MTETEQYDNHSLGNIAFLVQDVLKLLLSGSTVAPKFSTTRSTFLLPPPYFGHVANQLQYK